MANQIYIHAVFLQLLINNFQLCFLQLLLLSAQGATLQETQTHIGPHGVFYLVIYPSQFARLSSLRAPCARCVLRVLAGCLAAIIFLGH